MSRTVKSKIYETIITIILSVILKDKSWDSWDTYNHNMSHQILKRIVKWRRRKMDSMVGQGRYRKIKYLGTWKFESDNVDKHKWVEDA